MLRETGAIQRSDMQQQQSAAGEYGNWDQQETIGHRIIEDRSDNQLQQGEDG